MKILKRATVLFSISVMFLACTAEAPAALDPTLIIDPVDPEPISAGTFSAVIDGSDFEVDITTATLENSIITINGRRGNEVISLRMPYNVAVNSVATPYVLEGTDTSHSARYSTSTTAVSEATIQKDLHMTFDESLWQADTPIVTILSGVTTIRGVKGAIGESVKMVLQTDASGSYTFGPQVDNPSIINTAMYTTGGAGALVLNAPNTETNGDISIDIDTDNKLITGTYNFDGRKYFTPTVVLTDADGDGVRAEDDVNDSDPSAPMQPAGYIMYNANNAIWLAGDADADGISNQEELNGPDGDPATTADNTDPYGANTDTDGDGVLDINEVDAAAIIDPCLPVQAVGYNGFMSTNAIWAAADCDGDGVLNGNEDTDGDGVSNEDEVANGTATDNPCDPIQAAGYNGYNVYNTTWADADCDGDTISNITEVQNGTDPYFMEYFSVSFTDGAFNKIPYTDGGVVVKRGLNITAHNQAAQEISGTFSFVSMSIGEDPAQWYLVTDGEFNVSYTED